SILLRGEYVNVGTNLVTANGGAPQNGGGRGGDGPIVIAHCGSNDPGSTSPAVTLVPGDCFGMIAGVVFNDSNNNGSRDSGEQGIINVRVNLSQGSQVTTVAGGNYTLTNILPGTYTLNVTVPAGYIPTTPSSVSVTVVAGSSVPINFGFRLAPTPTFTPTRTATVTSTPTATGTATVSPTPTPKPLLLMIYALAYDNNPTSDSNLTPYYYATLDPIVEASRLNPNTLAIVLADLDHDGDTQIHRIRDGVMTPVLGLPDTQGFLQPAIKEYNMTDGATLGGFLLWARRPYPTATTIFTFVGHNAPLVPATDINLIVPVGTPQPTTFGKVVGGGIPLPTWWVAHPDLTDEHPRRLLSAYELAQALQIGSQNLPPIAVLDLINCFAGSIEQLYELAPHVTTITASPNYVFLDPSMLGQVMSQLSPRTAPLDLAKAIVRAYDAILPATDHPRLLVAVDSAKLLFIKPAWNRVAVALQDAFQSDYAGTRTKLKNAYEASAKYDTTFCPPPDWNLAPPDALSDLGGFAAMLSAQFGAMSPVGVAVLATQESLDAAILARYSRSGIPWFTAPATPTWSFPQQTPTGVPHYSGIALFTDFEPIAAHETTYLNWQSRWYTDTKTIENPHPFLFLRGSSTSLTTWADVFATFWRDNTSETWTCLPTFPAVQHQSELAVTSILLPLAGMVTHNSPTYLAAEITTIEPAQNVWVRFEVRQNGNRVYSTMVNTGYLVTGTHAIYADVRWIPKSSGPYELRVTVDPDDRYIEGDEENNTLTFEDWVLPRASYRPTLFGGTLNGQQWFPTRAIPMHLTLNPTAVLASQGNAIRFLVIQTYQYLPGTAPTEAQVPSLVAEQRLYVESIADFTLMLTPNVKAGPIVLHIWGVSISGPTVDPLVVSFNFIPPETDISSTTTHYYMFNAQVNEKVDFSVSTDPANSTYLHVWYPNNYGAPDKSSLGPGEDLTIKAAPLTGRYTLAIQGGPQSSSSYTLTTASYLPAQLEAGERPTSRPSAATRPVRPFFVAPVPRLSKLFSHQMFLPFLRH
ncbi:MAG: hypothetical protein H0T73_22210, partial [Ardenticatenales bacterium]|nr:hypothetical protein [Ardenticatenales bacterium]